MWVSTECVKRGKQREKKIGISLDINLVSNELIY